MRLLLAEDEKSLSKALVSILKHENYSVDAVYNGADAIDYAESGVYDCMILDVMMPKADGITVLKTLRAAGNKVPVILLTAKTQIEDRVTGLDAGADDYLTKPFAAKELLARIRAVTRRQPELKSNVLTFGDLKLDKESFELSTVHGSVTLTSKEFQIMELFLKNPKVVLSVDTLMDRIWGFDSEADVSVVWTYVSYLRKKLKGLSSAVRIKSVRNLGYRPEYGGKAEEEDAPQEPAQNAQSANAYAAGETEKQRSTDDRPGSRTAATGIASRRPDEAENDRPDSRTAGKGGAEC